MLEDVWGRAVSHEISAAYPSSVGTMICETGSFYTRALGKYRLAAGGLKNIGRIGLNSW